MNGFSSSNSSNGHRRTRSELGAAERDGRVTKPRIDVGHQDLDQLTKLGWEAVAAGNEPPTLFRFGERPVRLDPRPDGSVRLVELDFHALRHEVAQRADCYRIAGKSGEVAAFPPPEMINNMLAARQIPLPRLRQIVSLPVFDQRGNALVTPGYHAEAEVYLALTSDLTVRPPSDAPVTDEIDAARALLFDDLMVDFGFKTNGSRAHAVALLLQPIVRLMIGQTPLYAIDKPQPGSGAGLFVDLFSIIATGELAVVTPEAGDNAEMRKQLTASLIESPAYHIIDNQRGRLDSSALAAAVTAETWRDRPLGRSQMVRVPVQCTWVVTGNNMSFSNEIARRTIWIRLDTGRERPWLREDFRHPDLIRWTKEHRSALIEALMTLVRVWLLAGRPYAGRNLGRFESWSQVLGGILEYVGIPGFLEDLEAFYDRLDAERDNWRRLIEPWWQEHGDGAVATKTIFEIASSLDPPFEGLGRGDENSRRIRLGKSLGKARDRVFELPDGVTIRLVDAGREHNAVLWRLEVQRV